MNVTGKVISIEMNVTITKKDGGTYQGARLTYRDSRDGKLCEKAFHANSLKYNAAVKNGLENLVNGEDMTMVMEKEGEYWNVKDVFKGTPADAQATTKAQQAPAKSQATNVTPPAAFPAKAAASNSTYSTKEERDQTQRYIVRQSSITAALSLANLNKLTAKLSVADVLAVAAQFEDHVFGRVANVSSNRDFEDMTNDLIDDEIPF